MPRRNWAADRSLARNIGFEHSRWVHLFSEEGEFTQNPNGSFSPSVYLKNAKTFTGQQQRPSVLSSMFLNIETQEFFPHQVGVVNGSK